MKVFLPEANMGQIRFFGKAILCLPAPNSTLMNLYPALLHTHSLIRFFVLATLLIVIIKAAMGISGKKPFGIWDNKFSLYLLIFTHLQVVVGFGNTTMSDGIIRYWTVEHIFGMLVAVVLITIGRVKSKRQPTDIGKHYRLLIYNAVALVIIVGVILMSGRQLLGVSAW
jgi:hypothetical protein